MAKTTEPKTPKAPKPWKPQLACDVDLDKVDWSVGMVVQVKIDGVRALNRTGRLVGRSLKEHANPHITGLFSTEEYIGFDGELVTGHWTDADLCRKTSGNCSRKSAKEDYGVMWYVFDYIPDFMLDKPYIERLEAAGQLVGILNAQGNHRVSIVPHFRVYSLDDFLELEDSFLKLGFEGAILRHPQASYKSGRATVTMNNYLRLKRFIDFEGVLVDIIEANENTNEKMVNELGRSERSSHKENMIPKGVAGMFKYRLLDDVVHNGKTLMVKDQVVDVGPGEMDHAERKRYWDDRETILATGLIGKAKFFPHGQKDKPRFPTHRSIRSKEDMS